MPVRLVHPHVERGVDAVGEAAVLLVELQRGDAEVEEARRPRSSARATSTTAAISSYTAWTSVSRSAIRREPLPREVERLLVAVDPDEAGLRAALEDAPRRGHPCRGCRRRRRPRLGEGRLEQLDDPVAQDGSVSLRGVAGFRHTGALWSCRVCVGVRVGVGRCGCGDLGSGPHPLAGCLSRWPGTGEVVPGRQRLEAGSTGPAVRQHGAAAQKRPGTTSSDCSAKACSLASR